VIEAARFGPFSGDIATQADTDDGRGETRDGSGERAPDQYDGDGDGESREDRAPFERWDGAAFDVPRVGVECAT